MTPQDNPAQTAASSSAPDTYLGSRRLLLARVGWLTVAAIILGLNVAGIPYVYAQYTSVCTSAACADSLGQLTPERVQALQEMNISPELYPASAVALSVVTALVFAAVAAVIFWRRSDERMALFGSFTLLVFGSGAVFTAGVLQALAAAQPVLWFPVQLLNYIGQVSFGVFFYIFPSGRFVPSWTRWLAIAWVLLWVPTAFFPGSSLDLLSGPLAVVFLISLVIAQVYRYQRVSNAIERQQTKWVVFGVAVALVGFEGMLVLIQLVPAIQQSGPLGEMVLATGLYAFILLIPLSIGVAILRSRLYEIDVLINRTLVYGSLTVSLALVYIGGVTSLQYLLRTLTGQGSNLAVVASTLLIAALFTPLRRRVQGFIDQRFYRRKYDAAKMLEAFSARLRDETDLDTLGSHLVGVVSETMQPAHVSLWLRPTQGTTLGEDVPSQEVKR